VGRVVGRVWEGWWDRVGGRAGHLVPPTAPGHPPCASGHPCPPTSAQPSLSLTLPLPSTPSPTRAKGAADQLEKAYAEACREAAISDARDTELTVE
jgi:hypothetical protein